MTSKEKTILFRQRFYGRQDAFGKSWESPPDASGKVVRSFMPACDRLWDRACHIRLKTPNKTCSTCEIRQLTPVSDDTVLKHIRGEQAQITYVMLEDGNIRFSCIDFDNKPGKEALGYKFEDVARVAAAAQGMGIPYAIARSTGLGYHIYFFFDMAYPAVKFRAVAFELLERAGIMQIFRDGIKPLPEIFPKSSKYGGPGSLGSAIKPPCIEPNFAKGRNCFVDDADTVIADQWAYLARIPLITAEQMDSVIAKEAIPVIETASAVRANGGPREKWQPSTRGSIEKVLEGCKAFRRVRDKVLAGQVLGHTEGFALYHLAINTADGEKWFTKHVQGWSLTDADNRQLKQSKQVGYAPWSCQKLQEAGVCVVGTKCFQKRPPLERVEGRLVARTDLPESSWPEPSPIRYSYGAGDDYLLKLINEVEDLKGETDEEERDLKLGVIIERGTVFDKTQREALKAKITECKLAKKSVLNKQFVEAEAKKKTELAEIAVSRTDIIMAGSLTFQKINPHGYMLIKPGKGDVTNNKILCNFDLYIEEEKTIIEDKKYIKNMDGKFRTAGHEISFHIPEEVWCDGNRLYQHLFSIAGGEFNIAKMDIDMLRQVSLKHGKDVRKKSVYFGTQGWHEGAYLTPSVLVDKDGVRPNTEKPVDIGHKEHASNLDFKLLSDSDFKETLFHIKKDLFDAFPHGPVMVGIGHTMMAGLITYLNIPFRPVLWFEGDSGAGKSQLCLLLQRFWGDFQGGANWRTTGNSMTDYGSMFKDALLLADDYKASNPGQTKAVIDTVHNAYEYSVRGALTKDGKQRGDKACRCLFIMSGEETPEAVASFIARLVLIEYPKLSQLDTKEAFEKCMAASTNYRGITPRFIHWILQQDRNELLKDLGAVRDMLHKDIVGTGNESRVANNTGLAFCGWKHFVRFMEYNDILSTQEAEAFIKKGLDYTITVRNNMSARCAAEQTGRVFLGQLKELLATGRVYIKGMEPQNSDRSAAMIGFITDIPGDNGTAFIYPGLAIAEVKKSVGPHFVCTSQSVGRQFKTSGIITSPRVETIKWFGGTSHRVWHVDLDKMGISAKLLLAHGALEFTQPEPNEDGVI